MVDLTRFQCSGVKICPHLHPRLQAFSNYSKVDKTWFDLLEETRRQPVIDPSLRVEESPIFRLTEGLFLTLEKNYYHDRPCKPLGRCTGRPALRSTADFVSIL
jgi:hypothetical protein